MDIENYDFTKNIKQYINKSPKTMNMFRKHDYLSMTGIHKKTELLLCIYCCKLLTILSKDSNCKYQKNNKYYDLVLSLYLDFFISSWKLCLENNITDDDDIMNILKTERSPCKF